MVKTDEYPPISLTNGFVGRTVGVVAPEVAAKMAGVETVTIVAGVAVVVEGEEARRVLVVAQDAAKGATRVAATGAVAAALEEAPEGGGTSQ